VKVPVKTPVDCFVSADDVSVPAGSTTLCTCCRSGRVGRDAGDRERERQDDVVADVERFGATV
jgi:hypothetical protein